MAKSCVLVVALALVLACETSPSLETTAGTIVVTEPPKPVILTPLPPVVDLRADVNRNGVVELDAASEDQGEDTFDTSHGAVFLANLDDDAMRCRSGSDSLSDADLPRCNDAEDAVLNGAADKEDLAAVKVRGWAQAPEGTTASVQLAPAGALTRVRLFVEDAAGALSVYTPGAALSLADLRRGLTLYVEGKDIIRDRREWDGSVDLTLRVVVPEQPGLDAGLQTYVVGTAEDRVRLQISPVMTFSHAEPATHVFTSAIPRDPDSSRFVTAMRGAVTASGLPATFTGIVTEDQWTQDFFETGYMAMPGPNGAQRTMTVFFRSANVEQPRSPSRPLRVAGRLVFTQFRGPDVAGIQQVDVRTAEEVQSLNSFGNYETIPPFSHLGRSYPLGRQLRGAIPTFRPDPTFTRMLDAQLVQSAVEIDTSWLLVGHVDETVSFLKVPSPRGWVLLANDARLARSMLQAQVAAGNGGVPMFVGKSWLDENNNEVPAQKTIAQVLADTDVMASSNGAAVKVDAQLAILKRETGVTDAEIIPVPFLHQDVYGGYSLAYNPGTVNMLVLDDRNVVVPDPFGPVINGRDIFKEQLETALAPYQVRVHWVDDWDLYHRLAGEVHCGSNAIRTVPQAKWWEVQP